MRANGAQSIRCAPQQFTLHQTGATPARVSPRLAEHRDLAVEPVGIRHEQDLLPMVAPIDPRDRLPRFPAKPAERLRVPALDHDLPATAWAGPRGQWTAGLVAPERRSHSPSVAPTL